MPPDVRSGGDHKIGFRVTSTFAQGLIKLELWGLWGDELADQFRAALSEAFRAERPRGGWAVLADISSYPPQRASVQAVHAEMMALGKQCGVVRSANLVSSALGRLQIKRLSDESGLPEFSFFTREDDALRWLASR